MDNKKLIKRSIFKEKISELKSKKFSFEINRIELPNGHEGEYGYIKHPGAALAVPITKDNKVIILRQYRFAVSRYLLEFPAGTLEIGETPINSIRREIQLKKIRPDLIIKSIRGNVDSRIRKLKEKKFDGIILSVPHKKILLNFKQNYLSLLKKEGFFFDVKGKFRNNKISKTQSEKKIIFIVGLPRSGTTLIEQILSAHKLVFGAGELNYLRQIINNHFIQDNKLLSQKISDYNLSEENTINNEYSKYLNNLNKDSFVVTDKAPQNFVWIGFIKMFFPNAKIIHSKRNYKDIFLSNYKNNFVSNDMDWSYDPDDILKYFNFYFEHMNFWKKKCEDFIYDINYEDIVNNSESEIRKLLNYCELNWDENCLNHHQSKKTMIKTVSTYQARKPIYKTSIDSNKYYLKSLEKYFNQLNYK